MKNFGNDWKVLNGSLPPELLRMLQPVMQTFFRVTAACLCTRDKPTSRPMTRLCMLNNVKHMLNKVKNRPPISKRQPRTPGPGSGSANNFDSF